MFMHRTEKYHPKPVKQKAYSSKAIAVGTRFMANEGVSSQETRSGIIAMRGDAQGK
jgi:hypothetical protein